MRREYREIRKAQLKNFDESKWYKDTPNEIQQEKRIHKDSMLGKVLMRYKDAALYEPYIEKAGGGWPNKGMPEYCVVYKDNGKLKRSFFSRSGSWLAGNKPMLYKSGKFATGIKHLFELFKPSKTKSKTH